jgi:hypothetical protein
MGLALSDENYMLAIHILKERFGNIQEVIDLHYNQMINLTPAYNRVESLREFFDQVEKHLRSLEVLNQNINQDVFVSMIRSKLPQEVLLQLEMHKGTEDKWTVANLRDKFKAYVNAREKAEQKLPFSESRRYKQMNSPNQQKQRRKVFYGNQSTQDHSGKSLSSAEALVTSEVRNVADKKFKKCRYCDKKHWSDECPTFRTIAERKGKLIGSCLKCLKLGHNSAECKGKKNCVYCGGFNVHHRSLCPKKFRLGEFCVVNPEITDSLNNNELHEESALVSCDESVLMQTARTEVKSPFGTTSENARILLDSGSQRT